LQAALTERRRRKLMLNYKNKMWRKVGELALFHGSFGSSFDEVSYLSESLW
jgi:hypothetical protein